MNEDIKQHIFQTAGLGLAPYKFLGICALCGGNFLAEILLDKRVKSFTVGGCDQTFYAHRKCLTKYAGDTFDVLELPKESPLRQAYEKAKV